MILDTLVSYSHFQAHSFAVVNVPTAGSLAPYYSGGFIENYQNLSYLELKDDLHYPGRLPASAEFDSSIPTASDFVNITGKVVHAGDAFYLYERPVPNDYQSPTYVIVYGHYTDPDDPNLDGDYYYKVDLMENSEYYPLYRNFKYQIKIRRITAPGSLTPEDAAMSAGSGDVSGAQISQNLNDISNGTSRIVVSYMSRTLVREYTSEDPYLLQYKFIPNVEEFYPGTSEQVHNNDLVADGGFVTITNQDGTVITGITVDDADDANGFRTVRLVTSEPSAAQKSEYLTITGSWETSTIYRKIKYTMLSTQTLYVDCMQKRVLSEIGEKEAVAISIPSELPESMFPLVFQIESSGLSITPDNTVADNNLPVMTGPTIVSGQNGNSFHFNKTLSFADYSNLPSSSLHPGYVTFTCHFVTNKEDSASEIYVANNYFHTGYDSFVNYSLKNFLSGAFSDAPMSSGALVTLTFEIETLENEGYRLPDRVYLTLDGLRPTYAAGTTTIINGLVPAEDGVRYYFEPATSTDSNGRRLSDANGNVTIYLRTSVDDGDFSVTLESDEYTTAHVIPYTPTFSNLGFFTNTTGTAANTLALGLNQSVYFRFAYETGYAGTNYPVTFTMTGLTTDDARLVDNGNGTFTFTPTDNNTTQYVRVKSTTRFTAVSVLISNRRYNPVTVRTLSRPTTLTIGTTHLGAGAGRPNANNTYVNAYYTDTYTNYINNNNYRTRFDTGSPYASLDQLIVNLANYGDNVENGYVYFNYSAQDAVGYNGNHYARASLADLCDAVTAGTRYTLNFSPALIATTNANYATNSLSYTYGDVTVGFNGLNSVYNSYVTANNRTITVSVPEGYHITEIVITYSSNNNRANTVTPSVGSGTRNNNVYTWTSGAARANVVTLALTKRNNYDTRIASVRVSYTWD